MYEAIKVTAERVVCDHDECVVAECTMFTPARSDCLTGNDRRKEDNTFTAYLATPKAWKLDRKRRIKHDFRHCSIFRTPQDVFEERER